MKSANVEENSSDGFVKVHTNDFDDSPTASGSEVALRAFVPEEEDVTVDTSQVPVQEEDLDETVYQVHFNLEREGGFAEWDVVQATVEGEKKEYSLQEEGRKKDCSSDPCSYKESVYARIPVSDFNKMGGQSETNFNVFGRDNLQQNFEVSGQEVTTLWATVRTR